MHIIIALIRVIACGMAIQFKDISALACGLMIAELVGVGQKIYESGEE